MNASTATPFQAAWAPRALGLLRIVTGYLFIAHGSAKLLGFPHVAMFDGLPAFSLPWIAGLLELVGGAAIVAGLFTRPVAFVLSGLMAFAYFIGHAPQGNVLLPLLNQGELAALYSFVFLFFSVVGGGAFAVDNLRGAKSRGVLAAIEPGRA